MKKDNLPKVSFVICTLNCRDFIERCLKSINKQDYPKDKVEKIVVDSYSTDGTIEVSKKLGARVILTEKRGYMEGKGMPKSIGCSKAKGEIVITIDSDNFLVEKDWIRKMIYPLIVDNSVDYCISRMLVTKSDPLINQYLSYVGTDPFAIYCSLDHQISLRNVNLIDKGEYFTYNNTKRNFFITGGYYLAFKKSTLRKIGGYTRDVDVAIKLASRKGGSVIAIPKDAHLHHLMTPSVKDFLRKKLKWGKYYFNKGHQKRGFNWSNGLFGKFGKFNFSYQVIKSLIFLPALFVSLKMIFLTKDKAWLLHAPMTWATTAVYIISYVKSINLSSQK